jgi:muconolactone delta-isomerase
MKILALEQELPRASIEQFEQQSKSEAARVWELYQAGVIRELYFRADQRTAVLILECKDPEDARQILSTLPFVKADLIEFEIIPLVSYDGFERLFKSSDKLTQFERWTG